MSMELITGKAGTAHIDSEDVGAFNAAVFGSGAYVMSGCSVSMPNQNTVKIAAGEILWEGRHIRVKQDAETVSIANGTTGYNRIDLVVLAYSKNSSEIETATFKVIQGQPTTGTPKAPSLSTGSILKQATYAEIEFCRVTLTGLIPAVSAVKLTTFKDMKSAFAALAKVASSGSYNDLSNKPTIGNGTLTITQGGTTKGTFKANATANSTIAVDAAGNGTLTITQAGVTKGTFKANATGNTTIALTDNNTTYAAATQSANGLMTAADKKKLDNILKTVYPVGAIYMSMSATSPATLFGGTWVQITGRFLFAANSAYKVGATGGEEKHALTINEMPSHDHTWCTNYCWNTGSAATAPAWGVKNATTSKGKTTATGGGAAHNNMPPYLVVYVWKRTA